MVESTTTIYDVARVAGVSMATVSRVVNGNANVKEKTRQKVLDAIAELDYRPNAVARGLASKRTTTVGVILPTITSTYFAAITRGVDDIASMYKYNMILANSDNDVEKEGKILETFLSKQVDGIVYMGSSLDEEVRTALKNTRTPVVLVGTIDGDKELPSVNIDYHLSAYQATTKLAKNGNKKIGYIMGSLTDAENIERMVGYQEALIESGLEFDEELVFEGNYSYEQGKVLVERLLDRGVTGVVVAHDTVAVGVLSALMAKGIKVPEDFEIIAGSNSPITQYTYPSLTSVNQPLYDLGAVAMRLLTKLMLKEEVEENQLILDHEIIERQSTK
ncbi:catabolite control protein A [Lactococcus protaetiae]|uniref:Catabolite control protein A n=1 Tax=Lactococcus protaetiae TaxID=2592653 RepID=A0A514ZAN6_9LACT|nr:catabolite control protein A [Lactococcus protaetiae]MCL2112977.1 catabolite control protein A [Streptococcaceae bacterium]QDK71635.1 catabolite control protein A [Lactococcus protaetiae]